MTQSDVTKYCFSEVEGSCITFVKLRAAEFSEQCDQVLDTLESEQSIVGVNLGGVSARIYALRALDQVDLTIVIPNAICPRWQWQCPSDSDRM